MYESLRFAIDTYRWLVILILEGPALTNAHENGCLASAGIANNYNFVLLVKGLF
jgi:hypothetical protein